MTNSVYIIFLQTGRGSAAGSRDNRALIVSFQVTKQFGTLYYYNFLLKPGDPSLALRMTGFCWGANGGIGNPIPFS
jgi:hypothetical protein